MIGRRILLFFLSLCLLTGCSSLLEREYSNVEPHSSKFWESEAAGTLRAENYQDIVNDLLILIGQHTESATVRLYNYQDEMTVADTLEMAAAEIQQETPMGAYAVEYIATTAQVQRGYYEISIQIGYRRTGEQIQAVVNATSIEALYALLDSALTEGRTELAVRIGYWGDNDRERVETIVEQIRQDHGLTESPAWIVSYYPAEGPTGLVEFILVPDGTEAETQSALSGSADGEADPEAVWEADEPPESGEPPEAENLPESAEDTPPQAEVPDDGEAAEGSPEYTEP